jgi:hypothetical protein
MLAIPLWFKILLAWFLLAITLGLVKYFARDKYVHRNIQSSKEKRATIFKSNLMIIKLYKYFFWSSPLFLIVIPFLTYKYDRTEFFHITVLQILLYILIFQDFQFRKFLIKKLKENNVNLPNENKDNEEYQIFLNQEKKNEQQQLKTQENYRAMVARLFPVFIGIAWVSFDNFENYLNITKLVIILITTFCFSMFSGYIDRTRINKFGITQIDNKVAESILILLVLSIWMNISIMLLMIVFNQRIFT